MMLWKYDFETINGETYMTGWQAWNDERMPVPEADKSLYVSQPSPGVDEMTDSAGNHRFIQDKNGYRLKDGVEETKTKIDRQNKIIKMKEDIVSALIENDLTVDDLIRSVKEKRAWREKLD